MPCDSCICLCRGCCASVRCFCSLRVCLCRSVFIVSACLCALLNACKVKNLTAAFYSVACLGAHAPPPLRPPSPGTNRVSHHHTRPDAPFCALSVLFFLLTFLRHFCVLLLSVLSAVLVNCQIQLSAPSAPFCVLSLLFFLRLSVPSLLSVTQYVVFILSARVDYCLSA